MDDENQNRLPGLKTNSHKVKTTPSPKQSKKNTYLEYNLGNLKKGKKAINKARSVSRK